MRTTVTSTRTRILTAVAGTAVAAGAVIGGFAAAGAAGAEPTGTENLQKCTAYINADGSLKDAPKEGCLSVDPFTEPGLTLEQRKALINTDAGTRAGGSADQDFKELEAKFGTK
ncbi:hypothetical protein TTY48_07660 [Tsukamurella sp. TY48]|uniref:hypothetical protein n=1 Tax=Tsukamurella sp. TY48 TaxID=2775495 RepID=UPI001C7DEED7|nr:hypothetical protein [Tsukamurella sp. TY48]GIZ96154.1 hypothetical protein TTY48_07660 [Tsukamurella sp. TY48]